MFKNKNIVRLVLKLNLIDMNNCIFNVNDLNTSLEMLGDSLYDRLSPIPDYGLNVDNSKQEILREVTQIGESFQINPQNVDEALKVFEDI